MNLAQVTAHRHLGVTIQSDLRWTSHVQQVQKKALALLHMLHRIRGRIRGHAMSMLYQIYVRPAIEYGNLVTSNLSSTLADDLERLQRRAARICLHIPLIEPVHLSSLLHSLDWPTLASRRLYRTLLFAHSILHKYAPSHILNLSIEMASQAQYSLRRTRIFAPPTTRTSRHRDSPLNVALFNFNQFLPGQTIHSKSQYKHEVAPLVLSSICSCSAHPPS